MKLECDFLVIGSGIAGLSFALHAAAHGSVIIITKKSGNECNTRYAQGGIACVLDPRDSFRNHITDTLSTGHGICNAEAVELLVRNAPDRLRELLEWGVHFTQARKSTAAFSLDLGKEGGHSAHRIVHAADTTGEEIESAVLAQARSHPNISIYEHHHAVELITNHHLRRRRKKNKCYGAYVLDTQHRYIGAIRAKITCVATGGAGKVYQHSTNPDVARGDGIAMAYRAGAQIANMEFIQFHPTMLCHEQSNSFLISEAIRGFGAVIKDACGRAFMDEYDPMKSLAPRDIVARAIDREIKRSGQNCVYLDIRHADATQTRKRFPAIYKRCKRLGIDITRDLIPVVPAAHYLCGGIKVDSCCKSSIENLYACGEAACTGVHGANRLASNSLLEAVVFSHRAAHDAGARIHGVDQLPIDAVHAWDDSGTIDIEEWILLSHNIYEIQATMWDYVGIVRSDVRLQRARRRISMLEGEIESYYKRTRITPELLDLRNVVTTAKLIVNSALRRHESRGLHYTTDYPEQDERRWKRDTIISKKLRY
ncbi:MAG: L-aspartate oxidase [Chitinivibrionales bacterium]|nr:L-aspartate oxidase [Chitinivibrionales bacterium]